MPTVVDAAAAAVTAKPLRMIMVTTMTMMMMMMMMMKKILTKIMTILTMTADVPPPNMHTYIHTDILCLPHVWWFPGQYARASTAA